VRNVIGETPRFYDTLAKRPLPPPGSRSVDFYACGITPYAPAHIGHARSFVVFDLMRHVLQSAGHTVRLVRNITDIDDKIIEHSRRQGVHWKTFSWAMAARNDLEIAQLGVEGDEAPRASEYVPQQVELVQILMAKGLAYQASTGDILFRVTSYPGTRLSFHAPGALLGEADVGAARVRSAHKDHVSDFVLWKSAKPDEPSWPSPWGDGRPGWHLECSAMIHALFGGSLDYHGGGVDLKFPHHQAEIQQSEAAYGHALAHRWVHHGSVRDEHGKKMSKSDGNYVELSDALSEAQELAPGAAGAILRLALLSASWTRPLDWSPGAISIMFTRARRWAAAAAAPTGAITPDNPVRQALFENLNTPLAYASLDMLASAAERGDSTAPQMLGAGLSLLGIHEDWRHALRARRAVEVPSAVSALAAQRAQARAVGDYAQSDRLRDQITAMGWLVEDSPSGTKLGPR
jgi:cysteinyl-tRNA synthetase